MEARTHNILVGTWDPYKFAWHEWSLIHDALSGTFWSELKNWRKQAKFKTWERSQDLFLLFRVLYRNDNII